MNDPMHGTHPGSADLQRFADGENMELEVASHIESCAACRDEVTAVRRVTAALSFGSKVPDSLGARIHARRAATGSTTPTMSLHRARPRIRSFMLPFGLAAAALLVVFVPRALRRTSPEGSPAATGPKGVTSGSGVLFETVVTEEGSSSIDSVSWDIAGPGMTVEVRYVAGRAESGRAERLAGRVVESLREGGVDGSAITVKAEPARAAGTLLPAGAVGITVRFAIPAAP